MEKFEDIIKRKNNYHLSYKVGAYSLLKFAGRCYELGWEVYFPMSEGSRADCLVLLPDNSVLRVQVKTARLYEDGSVIQFNTFSSHYHTKLGQWTGHFKRTYEGQVDAFGVYCIDNKTCYLVPMTEIGSRKGIRMRVKPTKNSQKRKIRWAKDFEL
jgi:hypothetical protein